jgi:TonB-linked SusC/RagA family outer membrane protein
MIVFVAAPLVVQAQEMRTVTGNVTVGTTTPRPFPGVRVSVKGTMIGGVTDTEGFFTLRMPGDAFTLVFTYLGYRAEEVMVPATNTVVVHMEQVAIGIEGIVVTALGFEREKKTLGYSVQDIQGDELSQVPEFNLVDGLHGVLSGVQVTQATQTGGTARIIIRGQSSISGNNQPLFVVDGVPIDNASMTQRARNVQNEQFLDWRGGIDYGNAAGDIDPQNIENISVLKGPTAAALYGSRAANGAVVITTKSGRGVRGGAGGLGLTASISFTAEEPLRLPSYQNVYGQGFGGEFRYEDGAGGGLNDHADESWGPRLCPQLEGCNILIDQFTGPQQPWVAHPDNVRSFYRMGQTLNTNVAISRSSDRSHVRLSLTRSNIRGMSPANNIERWSLAVKGGANISNRLITEASLNYIDLNGENRPGTGYDDDNPQQSFTWFGRQVDIEALRNYECTEAQANATPYALCEMGGQYNWNHNYHNNPFWEAEVNGNNDNRDRMIGHVMLNYQVNDWLTATGRVGRDWYRDRRKRVTAQRSLEGNEGGFGEELFYRTETNTDFILNASRDLTASISLDATLGVNLRRNSYEGSGITVGRLTAPFIYTIDNAAVTPNPWDNVSKRETRGLYGSVSLNYGGYLNLDLTGRNDWSSTLPDTLNSYFYPSVSGAFVFTDAMGLESPFLSSGKVRASWTRVGNDADPYQLASVYAAQVAFGNAPMFAVPNRLANPGLKPEETTAWEVGTDLGFFDQRLGFVLTYYNRNTINQILPVEVSKASGYDQQMLNAGAVKNNGWELLLRANPIRSRDFNWDLTVNWSRNTSEVTELHGDLETLVLGTAWSLNVEARLGEPYGVLFGNGYVRCRPDATTGAYVGCTAAQDGMLMLSASGMPQKNNVREILGNYNPDWVGGIQNRFSIGSLDLSVLIDGQRGGDVFSVTNWFGEYAGVLESTLRGRDNDNCDPGIIVEGILPDGSMNTTNMVCPESYFGRNYGIQEAGINDATYLKLREVRLGFELPREWVSWTGFTSANFALIGRNLALWTPNMPNIDPETAFDASNVQGFESGQFPTARSFGFSLSLR